MDLKNVFFLHQIIGSLINLQHLKCMYDINKLKYELLVHKILLFTSDNAAGSSKYSTADVSVPIVSSSGRRIAATIFDALSVTIAVIFPGGSFHLVQIWKSIYTNAFNLKIYLIYFFI